MRKLFENEEFLRMKNTFKMKSVVMMKNLFESEK